MTHLLSSVQLLSRVRLLATPWTAAHQAPPSVGFSRQEYWSRVPLPSPNPLSVVSFAIIFSHSEGSLFTLLIVSFALQKLLSLIRAHLLTFVFISLFPFMHWRRKWQPTPVFLPGESQGRGSLVDCHLCGCTESDTTEES